MNTSVFESRLLPDGHLYCPREFTKKRNVLFKVIAMFEENEINASENDIELSAINDNSIDFLSKEELDYYFSLKEL